MITQAVPTSSKHTLVELRPMTCIFLELENSASSEGLDFDAEEVSAHLFRVKKQHAAAIDWSQGIIFQLDGLAALLRGRFAEVRQTVCLALAKGPQISGVETCRFRAARALRTRLDGDLGPAVSTALRETKAWLETRPDVRLGDIARVVVFRNQRVLDVEVL